MKGSLAASTGTTEALKQEPAFSWKGQLAKSGATVCRVACCPVQGATVDDGEPSKWPQCLDVIMRADLSYVMSHVYKTCPHVDRLVSYS